MDDSVANQATVFTEVLQDQIDILLSILERPVVYQQILAVLLILGLAWLLPEAVRRWRRRFGSSDSEAPAVSQTPSRRQRWLIAVYHLLTPILALVLLNVTIWIFGQQEQPSGLLQNFTLLIWLWFSYRLLQTFLYARFGEATRPYRNRILIPFFLFLICLQLISLLPGSVIILSTRIGLGSISVSFRNLLGGLVIFYLFIIGAWIVKEIMIHSLPGSFNAEPGVIESVATLTRYAILAVGTIFSLGVLGLDFTSLAIVAGGLSVGIGIGLQEIVANFVSGLVLLFEQSLRPGDVVEIDGRINRVEKISLRATTVRTRTNEELIIPNTTFTTQQVKNLTKSDRLVLVLIPLGVSYGSNPEAVRKLAIEASLEHPLVLPMPPPDLLFTGFGDSSLTFNLSVSINQPERTFSVRSDLYYILWKTFAEHDIEIPFPQRDLNLGDGWNNLLGRANEVEEEAE